MQLWKLILAYDGSPFHGWQVQPTLPTIQGTLAAAIRQVTRETVLPQGSGRTDTGVHALAQVVSFTLVAPIPPENLQRALNRALPPSIRVISAEHAPDLSPAAPFHARHSAVGKTYEYRIFPRVPCADNERPAERICPPTLAPFAWDCPWPIDLDRANEAARHILGEHDFSSFAASDPDLEQRHTGDAPSPIRRVVESTWTTRRQLPGEPDLIVYRVTGSGFLHHMVRNLVGTFVDAASGRISPAAIPAILSARDRRDAGPTAPAQGLFLVEVEYPPASPRLTSDDAPIELKV